MNTEAYAQLAERYRKAVVQDLEYAHAYVEAGFQELARKYHATATVWSIAYSDLCELGNIPVQSDFYPDPERVTDLAKFFRNKLAPVQK